MYHIQTSSGDHGTDREYYEMRITHFDKRTGKKLAVTTAYFATANFRKLFLRSLARRVPQSMYLTSIRLAAHTPDYNVWDCLQDYKKLHFLLRTLRMHPFDRHFPAVIAASSITF